MASVWTARNYHVGGYIPQGGWEVLKTQLTKRAQGVASPQKFTPEYGIQDQVTGFVTHGLSADWSIKESVLQLNEEGAGIDDFMQKKVFELANPH